MVQYSYICDMLYLYIYILQTESGTLDLQTESGTLDHQPGTEQRSSR